MFFGLQPIFVDICLSTIVGHWGNLATMQVMLYLKLS